MLQTARQAAWCAAAETGRTRCATRCATSAATAAAASRQAPARRHATSAPAMTPWSTQKPASPSARSLVPQANLAISAGRVIYVCYHLHVNYTN